MSIQLGEIVLFSHDGRIRRLKLKPGAMNIITGGSKTGKSALIAIVDYCFGSGTCKVPEGPIRRAVSWYGLKLILTDGEAFVARRCPDQNLVSSEECYLDAGTTIDIPAFTDLRQTTNTDGVISMLSGWSGIRDYEHQLNAGQTRAAITATVRHAIPLCFQPQDEIIRRQQLFHGDHWALQSLRDALPYFLGAVDDDYVKQREKLRQLREKLRKYESKLAEINSLHGEGFSKADALLAQARDAGLTDRVVEDLAEKIDLLRLISSTPLVRNKDAYVDGQEFLRLSNERSELLTSQRSLRADIASAQAFQAFETGFSGEATEQQARLKSIGIFDGKKPGETCPLCTTPLKHLELPGTEELRGALSSLSTRLEAVTRAAPQTEKAVADLGRKLQTIQDKLSKNRAEMEAVRAISDRLSETQDDDVKKSHIVGRVSLYIESFSELPETTTLQQTIDLLRREYEELEEKLSAEAIMDRVQSIVAILSQRMTEWAQTLQLEHSAFPLRFDVKKLTIVVDTPEAGPVPMERMGSGENWVGYHLIAHLALHQWFAERKRPVPHFLFLDQPSQVYFLPERNDDPNMASIPQTEREAVVRMFHLIYKAVQMVSPNIQVILTEHADIVEDWYQQSVIERWREDEKLLPDDWPRKSAGQAHLPNQN